MFSNLTGQLNSWMKSNNEKHEEDDTASASTSTANDFTLNADSKKNSNSTKDLLMKMKNEIDGWLGIKNKEEGEDVIFEQANHGDGNGTISSTKIAEELITNQMDEGDNSNYNENDAVMSNLSNNKNEKKDEPFKEVSDKAFAVTKSFGNLIVSAFNVAGNKIKKSIEDSTFLNDLINEQDLFNKKHTDAAVPPWSGCTNEDILKEECLNLSNDSRNFVRNPPSGVDFHFEYDVSYPVAIAIMEEDPKLEKLRFEHVPKIITEEKFWRNYFYRVSLIRQAHELTYMNKENEQENLNSSENTQESNLQTEFISDSFQESSSDVNLIEDLKKLSVQETTEEEWVKELEVELKDYQETEKKMDIKDGISEETINTTSSEEDNICAHNTL